MLRAAVRSLAVCVLAVCCLSGRTERACAQVVWSGFDVTFTKPNDTDPTLPLFQDRITDNVWITRAVQQGIFNAAVEEFYAPFYSPAGTRWATQLTSPGGTIAAANWQALTFTDWQSAYGSAGQLATNITSFPAVVHLVSDDVYLDLQFTAWTASAQGGGFSYQRATGDLLPPPPATTGDYNLNGIVDAADYTVWRDTLGQIADPPGSGADGDQSGIIDIGDYDFWKARFGDVVPLDATAAAVPEPCTLGLLLAVVLTIGVSRRPLAPPRR